MLGDRRQAMPLVGKLLSGALPSKAVLVTTRLLEETRLACAAICQGAAHGRGSSMHMPVRQDDIAFLHVVLPWL